MVGGVTRRMKRSFHMRFDSFPSTVTRRSASARRMVRPAVCECQPVICPGRWRVVERAIRAGQARSGRSGRRRVRGSVSVAVRRRAVRRSGRVSAVRRRRLRRRRSGVGGRCRRSGVGVSVGVGVGWAVGSGRSARPCPVGTGRAASVPGVEPPPPGPSGPATAAATRHPVPPPAGPGRCLRGRGRLSGGDGSVGRARRSAIGG